MSRGAATGMGAGLGIVVGTVLFALTENAAWIGIGIAIGAGLGVTFGAARSGREDDAE